MSDAAASGGFADDPLDGSARELTPAAIDGLLADFRTWLLDLANGEPVAPASPAAESVDLFALVGQFTALRHEVNMQTRTSRTAVEQNAELLKLLSAAQQPADRGEDLRPVAKGLVDIADALTLSLRQLEKFQDTAEPLLQTASLPARSPGFFARHFATRPAPTSEPVANPALEKLRNLIAAAADGYALSLRRVERLLPALDLEPHLCVGEAFDPETMEAVEVVGESEYPSGTVLEVVRPGYRWRGKLLRFAQVKVAR